MNSPLERLWSALADHFLDTETRHWLPRTARVAIESGLDWPGVERELRCRVGPVAAPNLLDIAGEWAGFPEDWLFARIRDSQGETEVSRKILNEMTPHWEALRRFYVHLSAGGDLPVLEGLAALALERDWTRCYRLFDHLEVFLERPWSEVCAAQALVQEAYRPLLVHPNDATAADARRSWQWLEEFRAWSLENPEIPWSADLQYLFVEADLSTHARVLELKKGPPQLRAALEGPLALLFASPELGLRNWDRFVASGS